MVRIWPGKKFRAESNRRAQACSNRDELGSSGRQEAWPRTYPGRPAPNGLKGSNLAPGGTAPGGSRPGMPDDGSIPGCGKPEWRGSIIIPTLRPLEREKAEKEMRLALERENGRRNAEHGNKGLT